MVGGQYRLLAVDVDSVLTEVDSVWRHLHKRLGTLREAATNAALFAEGKISYEEWARLDTALWRGVRVEEVLEAVSYIKLRKGAVELVRLAKEKGMRVVAISAGLNIVAGRVAAELGMGEWASNELVVRDGVLRAK